MGKYRTETSAEESSCFLQHSDSSLGPLLIILSVEGFALTSFFKVSQFSISLFRGTCWLFPAKCTQNSYFTLQEAVMYYPLEQWVNLQLFFKKHPKPVVFTLFRPGPTF